MHSSHAARSESPSSRKRGMVTVDYKSTSQAKEAITGMSVHMTLNHFNLIRVIGRGSYAKVILVSDTDPVSVRQSLL